MMKTTISPSDILQNAVFEAEREHHRARLAPLRRMRRVAVGPYAMFYFECFDTLWWQIQEMVRIEQGGAEQIVEEIAAYRPLLPQGSDWTATLMFEIPGEAQRRTLLAELGHVEKEVVLRVNNETIKAQPTDDDVRTTDEGKTSAVHFLRFAFPEAIKDRLLNDAPSVTLAITHPQYPHETRLSTDLLQALRADLKP
jgi:hypothetical protein